MMDAQQAQSVPQSKFVPQTQPSPAAQLAAKAALFAESQRAAATSSHVPHGMVDAARPSLFNTMTGAFRRRPLQPGATAVLPQVTRREPEMAEYQAQHPQVSVRQTSVGDETGIEIPAFLRRQHS
jgi:cell division protein FtsZ